MQAAQLTLVFALACSLGSAQTDPIIDAAREKAFSFTQSLPNYMVKQLTTRYSTDLKRNDRNAWLAQTDIVTADVVYENGRETYSNLLENGKRVKDVQQTGAWSEGEFAGILQTLLSASSEAQFTMKQPVTLNHRAAVRYAYTVAQPHSSWKVQVNGETYRPKYSGQIWIDKDTNRVLRIEMAAQEIPREFPMDLVTASVEYDFVLIGESRFLLPVRSETASCLQGTSECTRNVIEFTGYRKYGSATSITFDGQ